MCPEHGNWRFGTCAAGGQICISCNKWPNYLDKKFSEIESLYSCCYVLLSVKDFSSLRSLSWGLISSFTQGLIPVRKTVPNRGMEGQPCASWWSDCAVLGLFLSWLASLQVLCATGSQSAAQRQHTVASSGTDNCFPSKEWKYSLGLLCSMSVLSSTGLLDKILENWKRKQPCSNSVFF